MKDTFYFPHDYHARHDPKLESLLLEKGVGGVGVYWCVVESLYEEGGKMQLKCERIAKALHTDIELIKSVITEYDLFENDGEYFWSESVNRRLDQRKQKSVKAMESARIRWSGDANAMRTQCERNAIKERKGKEIKGKERKEKIYSFQPPTLEQVAEYCKEIKSTVDPEMFFHNYESSGWIKANGQRVMNWKSTIRTWEKKQQKFPQQQPIVQNGKPQAELVALQQVAMKLTDEQIKENMLAQGYTEQRIFEAITMARGKILQ